jgi:hypothetical protein
MQMWNLELGGVDDVEKSRSKTHRRGNYEGISKSVLDILR